MRKRALGTRWSSDTDMHPAPASVTCSCPGRGPQDVLGRRRRLHRAVPADPPLRGSSLAFRLGSAPSPVLTTQCNTGPPGRIYQVLEPDEPVPTFVERPTVTRTYSQDPRAELSDGGRSGAASAVASSPANADTVCPFSHCHVHCAGRSPSACWPVALSRGPSRAQSLHQRRQPASASHPSTPRSWPSGARSTPW